MITLAATRLMITAQLIMTRLIILDAPVDIDGPEARRRALEILRTARYLQLPAWLEHLLDRLVGGLDRLLAALLSRPLVSGAGLNWPLLVVVVIIVGLGALIVWRVGLPRRSTRAAAEATVAADPTLAPTDYRTRADRAAASGDYATAIRERFRGVTRALEDATVLEPRPSRTAAEVARLAGALLPDAAGSLDAAAWLFGEISYGGNQGRASQYASLVAWDDDISRAAAHRDLAGRSPAAFDRPAW